MCDILGNSFCIYLFYLFV